MAPDHGQRGWIIPIGGGERKVRSSEILSRFAELSGGPDGRIVVIPAASRLKTAGSQHKKVFRQLGVPRVDIVRIESRSDCEIESVHEQITAATGVFLTGGNQLRLSTNIGGTSVARILRRRNADGVPIAGTSAGAAFLCEHMIAHGADGATPRSGMVHLAPGLGLTNKIIIDQHFRQRDRLGRLLTALAYNPFAVGIGLDEDTAAFIDPEDRIEVLGSGGLTVIDPSHIDRSSMDSARLGDPIGLIGVRLHIMLQGDRYDLTTRAANPADQRS
ncbi:MAG: cyanophycinase [Alphaproteobacteria bacterium]|nr:cyanophycinase [Alphaproteobacteria bacterium]